jgi:hypothetical protein
MARAASEEPVTKRFWHRVPWLFAGLLHSRHRLSGRRCGDTD